MNDYSTLDKILHYLALQSVYMRRMAFDLDKMFGTSHQNQALRPVYISGLARAGTTILLQALYSTGDFATLTYRNMPFVMAPRIWPRFTRRHRSRNEVKERAHNDRLKVSFDSPEAFEEVFWLTATEASFVKTDHLSPHQVPASELENYREYIGGIIGDTQKRYLAKNNNNILRIKSLLNAYPDARIIVPFRNPVDHAHSLMGQHRHFKGLHVRDKFALRYMNWLGHFEFGSNFKPFDVGEFQWVSGADSTLEFWLDYWNAVYEFLYRNHRDDVIFLDYDRLCAEPESSLGQLGDLLDMDSDRLRAFAPKIRNTSNYGAQSFDLPEQIEKLHKKLQQEGRRLIS